MTAVGPKSKRNYGLAAVGMLVSIFSMPCVIAMIHDLIVGTDNITGALVVGTFCAGLAVFGFFLTYVALRKPKPVAFEVTREVERQILVVAKQARGRISAAELAMHSDLSVDESRRVLEHFELNGVATSHVTTTGDIVYLFSSFTTTEETMLAGMDWDDGTDADPHASVGAEVTSRRKQ